MSYYNNIEFVVSLPAASDGTNSNFPTMGQFVSTGGDPVPTSNNQRTVVAITPPDPSVIERNAYNFIHVKGVVYKKNSSTNPSHAFEIKNFIDYPYSSVISNIQTVYNSDSDACSITSPSSGFDPQTFLIFRVNIADTSIRNMRITGITTAGENNWPLTIKGTYLLI